jgi:hypothetical protein
MRRPEARLVEPFAAYLAARLGRPVFADPVGASLPRTTRFSRRTPTVPAVIAAPGKRPDELLATLARASLPVAFAGTTPVGDDALTLAPVAVLDSQGLAPARPAPAQFRVVAIVTSYNEIDILPATIERLLDEGVGVAVVDNWSTDGSWDLLTGSYRGRLCHLERFPSDEPAVTYQWRRLLSRVAELAVELGADWTIHHDADEIRESPWPGVGLRDALFAVGERGWNAVDHTVVDFRPTRDEWREGLDPAQCFEYFAWGRRPGHFLQIKAWSSRSTVDLATSGGHEATFAGRRVYPYKFLLRHYPLRSPSQARTKIFQDRRPRLDAQERADGWHFQYDQFDESSTFLWPPEELVRFDQTFWARFLVERLSGVGLRES